MTIGKNKTQNYFLFFFAANENGHKLSLGKLIARKYKWIAKTKFNGKTYKKFEIFIVEDSALKKNRNCRQSSCYETSRRIIKREILAFEVIDKIRNRGDITIISFEETNVNKLMDYLFVMLLFIFLLSCEWFISRYLGSY